VLIHPTSIIRDHLRQNQNTLTFTVQIDIATGSTTNITQNLIQAQYTSSKKQIRDVNFLSVSTLDETHGVYYFVPVSEADNAPIYSSDMINKINNPLISTGSMRLVDIQYDDINGRLLSLQDNYVLQVPTYYNQSVPTKTLVNSPIMQNVVCSAFDSNSQNLYLVVWATPWNISTTNLNMPRPTISSVPLSSICTSGTSLGYYPNYCSMDKLKGQIVLVVTDTNTGNYSILTE